MALCKFPIYLKQAGGIVPCGQCFTCRLNKARFWTFRLMMEARLHEETFWTTLTYQDVFLPRRYYDLNRNEEFANSFGTLSPRDIELFIKRLRKILFPTRIRYFIVGEYGETTQRPHYHVCIFGAGEKTLISAMCKAWIDPVSKYPLGIVDRKHCGPLTRKNARYTVGYTIKKLTKVDDVRLDGRYPEFIRCSKGIGVEFAKRFADSIRNSSGMAHILNTGDIPRAVRYDGRMWPLDRYLREKILDHLGLKNVLLEKGQERFSQEMRSMSRRAELNPKFLSAVEISPTLMEMQYQDENSQKVLNTEKRAKLMKKEKIL